MFTDTDLTGVPVRGVIPLRSDIQIDNEDSQDITSAALVGEIDVCVLRLPTVSNFTDLDALATMPGVSVRYAEHPVEVGNPDLLILPGAKDTLSDLRWLRQRGLDRSTLAAAARSIPVLGLCGGFQILGRSLADPSGTGGSAGPWLPAGAPREEPAVGPPAAETRAGSRERAWYLG